MLRVLAWGALGTHIKKKQTQFTQLVWLTSPFKFSIVSLHFSLLRSCNPGNLLLN